jgi:hypothetical protein
VLPANLNRYPKVDLQSSASTKEASL